ncbi:MAG: hypothetical protein JO164_09520 [Candidatus Eremiobacteraeota bacterium]|nr:hypothetical protein [Candidatus Eremiobacteraeota bacterium]
MVPDASAQILRRRKISDAAPEFDAVRRLHDGLARSRSAVAAGDLQQLTELGLVVDVETIAPRPRFCNLLAVDGDSGERNVPVVLQGEIRFGDADDEVEIASAVFARGDRFWHAPKPGRRGLPWWPDARLAQLVQELVDTRSALVSEAEARALREAGIVGHTAQDEDESQARAATSFAQRHHAIAHVFPLAACHALAAFYRELCVRGFLFYGDSARRYFSHNDRVGLLFQEFALDAVRNIVRRPIKSSYSYFSGYRNEALLVNHRDREQCEYTLNVMLAYRPADVGSMSWPLLLEGAEGIMDVRLAVGESALFEGRVLEHRRPPLPPGDECDLLLMHYVDDEFEGSLE